MSESPVLEHKKRIELPKALRDIVKALHEEGPLTYEELAEKLGKDETTVMKQCKKLEEMEIVVKIEKEGKTAYALREDVEVDEEGNVYIPSPFEDPIDKLKELLEEAGVKGRKLNWILRLVETNPQALENPDELYDILTGAGIRRQLARQIVKAYFGTEPTAARSTYPFYHYGPYGPAPSPVPYGPMRFYNPWYGHGDREIVRLEMMLERLKDELRELKESKSSSSVPMVRRVKYDEQGRPIEVIEEPAAMARSSDTEMILKFMEMRDRDKDRMYEMMFKMMDSIKELANSMKESIKELGEKMTSALVERDRQWQERAQQIEEKYRNEIMQLREQLAKKDAEYAQKQLQEIYQTLQSLPERIRKEVEKEYKHELEKLKLEMEFEKKLRELESRLTLRDLAVGQIKKGLEKLDKVADKMIEYMEVQMKQQTAAKVPQVSEEEKKKILSALRRAAGKREATESRKEEKKEPSIEPKLLVAEESKSEECPSGICKEEEG